MNFFGLKRWLDGFNACCATHHAVTSTFLGDLPVLFIHHNTPPQADLFTQVFYKAVLTRFSRLSPTSDGGAFGRE